MPRRLSLVPAVLLGLLALPVTPAAAQQSITFNFGYFSVKGEDSRVAGDVLFEDRNYLLFSVKDFSGGTFGGEYLTTIGDFLEAGAGVGYYARTVPSVYDQWVNSDGSEIQQDLRLRITPITATIRILPLSRHAPIQPYVGGGIGIFLWRYTETGEFVDFNDNSIFQARYEGQGTAVGPVAVFGVRAGGRRVAVGFEVRYQKAQGTLNANDFYGDRIDLGGFNTLGTLQLKF